MFITLGSNIMISDDCRFVVRPNAADGTWDVLEIEDKKLQFRATRENRAKALDWVNDYRIMNA